MWRLWLFKFCKLERSCGRSESWLPSWRPQWNCKEHWCSSSLLKRLNFRMRYVAWWLLSIYTSLPGQNAISIMVKTYLTTAKLIYMYFQAMVFVLELVISLTLQSSGLQCHKRYLWCNGRVYLVKMLHRCIIIKSLKMFLWTIFTN